MEFPAVALLDDGTFDLAENLDKLVAMTEEVITHGNLVCVMDAAGSTWIWSLPPSQTTLEEGEWVISRTPVSILCANSIGW